MGRYAVIGARGATMRAGASLWRVATAAAFGATAALAVALSRSAPVHVALTSAGPGAAHGASSRPAAATGRCAAAGLRIWLKPGDRVSAATTRYPLEFTNVSGAPCTLDGYPQVAAYRGGDVQVGPAAAHDMSVAARPVLLAPGQTAYAVVDASVPAARCRPARASGLRVVPPGQVTARYVSRPLTACAARAGHGRGDLLVCAVRPGTGAGGSAGTLADVRPSPGDARQPAGAA